MNELKPSDLFAYQRESIIHQLNHVDSVLWLGMGLGKTPITLTTIVDRMRAGHVKKVLIFGTLRIIQSVWRKEALKWTHTSHLKFSIINGTKQARTKSLFEEADIYMINYDNMNWLAETLDHYYFSQDLENPFQMIVYDEITRLKKSTTLRMAGGNRDRIDRRGEVHKIKVTGWNKFVNLFKYRAGLTGTPASNGYIDLHGQYLVIDGGERLGKFITTYRQEYFTKSYDGWGYTPTQLGKAAIVSKISDITLKMDSKDYLDLPAVKVTNHLVDLPKNVWKSYKELEKTLFTQLESGVDIELSNKTSLSNKILQFCNGSPYINPMEPEFDVMHDAKLDELMNIVTEAAGSPVLCSYSFKADAQRIMKKMKKFKPVNLTESPSRLTGSIIDKWNKGEIKLLIGHPACLHPDTLLLTERRGWIKLIDISVTEKVFDGVDFVSHGGCLYSGYKEVNNLFGVTMTHNHRLLISGKWVESCNVENCENIKKEALYKYKGNDKYLSKMFTLRGNIRNPQTECNKTQPFKKRILSTLYQRKLSQHDKHSNMENMARNDSSFKKPIRQKLCRSWDKRVRKLVGFQNVLHRYAQNIQKQFDYRKNRCEQGLFKRKLYVGHNAYATVEQKNNTIFNLQRFKNTSSRVMPFNRVEQNEIKNEIRPGDDSGSSGDRRNELTLRKKYEPEKQGKKRVKKNHVYDLVDCGPRHRFLIKNAKGEVFTSHNSMGHGIDGLQYSGSIVVWFGLNWSLELYEQMNGRINRLGQTKPVSIIRILCRDTIDLIVAIRLDGKYNTQEGLKAEVDKYRGVQPVQSFLTAQPVVSFL